MHRVRVPAIKPLEVWDMPVLGRPLQAWRHDVRYGEALAEAVVQLKRLHGVTEVHLCGGGATEALRQAIDNRLGTLERVLLSPEPRTIAARSHRHCIPGADDWRFGRAHVGIDVGQTSVKIHHREGDQWFDSIIERDLDRAPFVDDIFPDERKAVRASTLQWLGELMKSYIKNMSIRHIVLALPCQIDDDFALGACTYGWNDGDATALMEIMKAAEIRNHDTVLAIDDAELAAASVLYGEAGRGMCALVLTIGFGTGAALIV